VGEWVSQARSEKYTPAITNAEEFGQSWWAWWVDINPSWRGNERPLTCGNDSSWDEMDLYGQNGFLNVLMSLKWWQDATDAESGNWREAVDEVTWVLRQM
jgi:hypothetical protein